MLLLLAGLITNFLSINQPGLFRITLVLLGVGFVSAIISSHLVNHWVREPRADQLLTQLLKKFGNDYVLFNYTSPVSHALLAPNGLYAIVVKPQDGAISVSGRRVSRRFDWRRLLRLLADEGLGSPVSEAEGQANRLKKFLGKQLTEEQIPPVMPIIIFSGKNVQLTVHEPAVPAMQTNELKSFLRDQEKNRAISPEQRRRLIEILGGQ
jgi:hypothetical protein